MKKKVESEYNDMIGLHLSYSSPTYKEKKYKVLNSILWTFFFFYHLWKLVILFLLDLNISLV